MRKLLSTLLTATLCLLGSEALATDAVTIGVLNNNDVHVVQKMLYPKGERTELGAHIGMMPFDAYLTTPNLQLSFDKHIAETLSISAVAGGGYGFKSKTYRTMESAAYGVAPYAYRYLGSVLGGVTYSPIYAKMSLSGSKVLHYDVYGTARAGVSMEQSVIPAGGFAIAPTLSLGVGSRIFLSENTALRLEFRDDMLVEYRQLTESMHFKQNANLLIGLSMLSPAKRR
jgi:outer membrane beta-barrel protein